MARHDGNNRSVRRPTPQGVEITCSLTRGRRTLPRRPPTLGDCAVIGDMRGDGRREPPVVLGVSTLSMTSRGKTLGTSAALGGAGLGTVQSWPQKRQGGFQRSWL